MIAFVLSSTLITTPTHAHDPVFGLGPHVLFKGGMEVAVDILKKQSSDNQDTTDVSELGLELTYGLTGDWAAGIDIPFIEQSDTTTHKDGQGDLTLFTKYRFWRDDGPGLQQSMALALKLKTDTADSNIGTGTTDGVVGLSYGYEARKWYRWAALRYRFNGENEFGLRRSNKTLLDLVVGIRPYQTGYKKPDTVWLLELNGELSERAELSGVPLSNTGGTEWFVSPGIFWTLRNFAIKAGAQLPISDNLKGNQKMSDYRLKLVLEWHI